MEIVVPLVETVGYRDCSTTRRYPEHYIEIIAPLGDIWRL